MEFSLTKHTVKTETELFCDTAEIVLEGNVGPFRGGNIKRILKCCHKSAITSKSSADTVVTVEGATMLSIIYIDEDNCLCSHEHALPFSKTFETNTMLSDCEVRAEIIDEKIIASLTPQNEIKISGAVCLCAALIKCDEREIVCDIDCKNIEQLRSNAELTTTIGYGDKNLIVEEEISIGNGQPSVGKTIRHSVTAIVDEAKAISDKVMVKGTIKVYVLYIPDEGTRPQCFEDSFPFSQLVDVVGVTEGCKCQSRASVLFSDLTPRVGSDDEVRAFSVAIKLNLSVKAYCDGEIATLLDAYSTGGGCRVETAELTFKKMKETHKECIIGRKTLEFTDGAIGSIIDMWCDIKNASHKFEKGNFLLSGVATANLLVYDIEGVPACYERPIEFEYTHTPNAEFISPEAEYFLSVAHCSYTVTGLNTLEVAVEPQIELNLYDKIKQTLITDVVKDDSDMSETPHSSSIVLYFAEEGERVWDIARRYNSSVSEIKELNNITEDTLIKPHKFIIPTK